MQECGRENENIHHRTDADETRRNECSRNVRRRGLPRAESNERRCHGERREDSKSENAEHLQAGHSGWGAPPVYYTRTTTTAVACTGERAQ